MGYSLEIRQALILGGGLTKLGFTYASDDVMIHNAIKQYSPVDVNFIKAGWCKLNPVGSRVGRDWLHL